MRSILTCLLLSLIVVGTCALNASVTDAPKLAGDTGDWAPKLGEVPGESDRYHYLEVSYSVHAHDRLVLFSSEKRGWGKLYLKNQEGERALNTLKDLANRVHVANAAEAMCYVRTFTSPDTCGTGRFPSSGKRKSMQAIELFVAKDAADLQPGHASDTVARRIGLTAATVRWTGKEWEVRRFVYVLHEGPAIPIVENVGKHGEYYWRADCGGSEATPEEVNVARPIMR